MAPRPPRAGQGRPQHGKPRGGGSRALAALLYAGVGLVCLALAAATFLLVAAPTDIVRDQIVAQVKARTGRDLVLGGPASLTFFPSLGIRLADVTLSAHPAMGGKPTATMAGLDVSVRLLPLLGREVVVERLVMRKPVIELRIDAQGRKSWDTATASQLPPWPLSRMAQAGGRGAELPADVKDFVRHASNPVRAQHGTARAGLDGLALGDVRIEDGTVVFSDERSGARQEATGVDVRMGLRSIAHPLDAKGSLVWRGEKIAFDGKLASLKALLEDKPAKLALTVAARPVEASYDGEIAVKDGYAAAGQLTAKAASVRALAAWLGTELPGVPGYGPAAIGGALKATERVVSVEKADLALDGATGTGSLAIELGGARPLLKANLRLSEVDLNKYNPRGGGARGATGAGASQPAARSAAQPGPTGPSSIDDLLRRQGADPPPAGKPGPQVRGFEQRAGWSEEPIDTAALGLLDAEVKLSCGRLVHQELKLGQSQVRVGLKGRVARIDLDDVQLYDGRARGLITLDGSAQALAVGINLQADGISALPLLKDASGLEMMSGRGRLSLALAGQGATQKAIVEALNGKADYALNDGALIGWNLAQILRGLQQGRVSGLERSASEKTEFTELAASFAVSSGIAQTKDLRLVSPQVRVTGAGNVMLPPRQLDVVVRTRLAAASPAGQGGGPDLSGIDVPVRIHGAWEKPTVTPDVQGLLKDPNQAAEMADKVGEKLGVKGVGNAVREFLNAPGEQGSQNRDKARQLLDKLIKR